MPRSGAAHAQEVSSTNSHTIVASISRLPFERYEPCRLMPANRSRPMVSTFLYGGLQYAGLPALRRRISRAAVVLCYHNVVPDGTTGGDPGLHLPVSEFRWQLDWIEAHYRVVALGELAERLRSGRSVRGLAVLTFDDAYAGAFQQAWPLLRARGLPA